MATSKPGSIDDYLEQFPEDTRKKLGQIRGIIGKAAPKAEETISYGIPSFKLNGTYLIYFAGFRNHVSVYPIPKGDAAFRKEIGSYKKGKGTLQFSLEQPLPLKVIRDVVKQSLADNRQRAKNKKA